MSTNKKYFSGNSIEQAVLQAARHFKLEAAEVAYRQVERRHGFLKSRRRAVIEVDVDNPRRSEGPAEAASAEKRAPVEKPVEKPIEKLIERPAEKPVEKREAPRRESRGPAEARNSSTRDTSRDKRALAEEPRPSGMTALPVRPARKGEPVEGPLGEAAIEAVRRLCVLGQLDLEAEVFEGEDGLEIEIRGKDEDVLLEDRGRLLLAMQHLMPRLIRGLTGEAVSCRVDCDNFQEVRAEQLRVLAQKVAAEVRDRGRMRTLEPMAPDERRIIHMTLADDRAVETESQGSGLFKRVKVMPVGRRTRSFEPYRR